MYVCMNEYSEYGGIGVVVVVVLLVVFSIAAAAEEEVVQQQWQWQILTESNYSSQIRLHPSLLLLVTLPWCGESRSLMKDLSCAVATSNRARFRSLKLMVLHKNVDRMLADALGATNAITLVYYHNTFSYKYLGKLRVQNILSSLDYLTSLSPHQLPLHSLTTPNDLKDFLDSTDKAVILFEFCGWTPTLLPMNKNTTENGFDFGRESNGTLAAEEKDNRKGMGNDKLNCGVDRLNAALWPSQFTSVNDTLMKKAENPTFTVGVSCSLDELQQFKLFFQKFIPMAREFFLPPERIRFALVRERSLLPLLNIEEQSSWFTAVSFAARPSSSKVLKEVDDLRTVLQTQASLVLELDDDLHGTEATLPAKRPTLLLFVDRSSNSTQIKKESQMALKAFRELAEHYEMENQIHGQANWPEKTSTETKRALSSVLKQSRLQPLPASKKLIFKDKMSIMIMNEGQQITLENLVPDLQGSSVHEILSYALKRKKEIKLSSLAKDAGFQLLSKDFDVEVMEALPQSSEVLSNQVPGEPPVKGGLENAADLDEKQVPAVSFSGQNEERPNPSDSEHIPLKGNRDYLEKSSEPYFESELHRHTMSIATDSAQGWNTEKRPSEIDENEQQNIFRGSFFFFDGQYRMLEALTGGPKMPSVVIVDPISQQHYVSDEQSVFNYSSLSSFVNCFLAGKLTPHQQSAPAVPDTRTLPRPPFVNLDFHEMDSIPQVTTHTFAELVLGNRSDSKNSGGSWNRNVLVLFSNSWCGFCQRMELVVREVYRAVKSYANRKMHSSWKEKWTSTGEYVEDVALKLPLIYMMDCTQNDCSLIIKSIQQRELYPLLLLFPADMKNNTLVYEGDIAVSDIIKFLDAHGSNVLDLIVDRSFLEDRNSVKQGPQSRSLPHEVLLKDRLQVTHHQITAQFPTGLHERPELFVGCFLSATEKLLDVHPFDESKILIVKVDQGVGFQGLIINKKITWDSFEELEEGFDLLKEAPLSFGGPVVRRGMPLVALTHKSIQGQSHEVIPNIYFIDPMAIRSLLEGIREGNKSVYDYWFFLGYSSWGWDQLFHEIAQGAWNVSQGNMERLEWPSH